MGIQAGIPREFTLPYRDAFPQYTTIAEIESQFCWLFERGNRLHLLTNPGSFAGSVTVFGLVQ
jgi:hypothetical protein